LAIWIDPALTSAAPGLSPRIPEKRMERSGKRFGHTITIKSPTFEPD
jgi:hypothetical protein